MNDPNQDNYTFTPAETFFDAYAVKSFNTPTSITYRVEDNDPKQPSIKTGAIFRFNDDKLLLVQFIRPKVWKIRFSPLIKTPAEYNDYNSRTIVRDTVTELRDCLDKFEDIFWDTSVKPSDDGKYFCLESMVYQSAADRKAKKDGKWEVRLFVQKAPFRIIAVRAVPPHLDPDDAVPALNASEAIKVNLDTQCIIWKTAPNGLSWVQKGETTNAILSVCKPGAARYIGFGEQGGMSLFKYSTYMNYFDYDNMMYSGVYGKGAGDSREPLYHSEPFWIEVDTHQNLGSKVATFVDNYSQISIDFGKRNNGEIRVGTKYGSLQYFVMAGNDIPDIINLYTSIIGRNRLKPRYVLGHHQGCYGYDTQKKVVGIVDQYRARKIPLDGMHIDVDLQDRYRTFTINTAPDKFPDPKAMFRDLRNMGVKACTNITPVINCTGDGYKTLSEGVKNKYFIMDKRYTADGIGKNSWDAKYMYYDGGRREMITDIQSAQKRMPGYTPEYDFSKAYNSEKEFIGGVSYGQDLGTPGFYPDLNREVVRKWWGEQYRYLIEQGLEFIWQDMTSPCLAKEYGDMKGLPFRLMVSTDVYPSQDGKYPPYKAAIEMWSLFSYNLHKATYKGLNDMDLRKGKRNFIIGRGSFAGMHRYAGLWTGDNASTWNFLRISVAQILASGLSGGVITGADVGGFMPLNKDQWADPELVIRWYCAYSMLPWFRNHYHGKPGMKFFQEPYVYTDHFWNPQWHDILKKDERMYLSVEPVCKYFVELRYTLLQLLYDAMFENQITGMPIARALILTDVYDDSLYKDASNYLYREYMVRNDLLVCPRLYPEKLKVGENETKQKHQLYLPQPDNWFVFNLRPDHIEDPNGDGLKISRRKGLSAKLQGGTFMEWDDEIRLGDNEHIPYVMPMFIREGAIIPQIELRQWIPDLENRKANPITLHVYPGKNSDYHMYLDDGISRASAPAGLPQYSANPVPMHPELGVIPKDDFAIDEDEEAKSEYREVIIAQRTAGATRTVTIRTAWDNYNLDLLKRDIGQQYTVIIWHEVDVDTTKCVTTTDGATGSTVSNDTSIRATFIDVPIDADDKKKGITITCKYN